MARSIEAGAQSAYRQVARFGGMFRVALARPVGPETTAAVIRHIIESGTWQFRHPSGPDAAPFLNWRASMGMRNGLTGMPRMTTLGTNKCSVTSD